MLAKLFPGLMWLQGYNRGVFKHDLFSGLTIAVMLIPQGMGYALSLDFPLNTVCMPVYFLRLFTPYWVHLTRFQWGRWRSILF
jgi:hypothetical protein